MILKSSKSIVNPYSKYSLAMGKGGLAWSIPVHRLVAQHFVENPHNYKVVHHKDHDKNNNRADNLEWTTPSKNIKYAIEAGHHNGGFKRGTKHHSGKFTDVQIEWIKKLKDDGYTLSELERIFNSSRGYLSTIINGKARTIKIDKPGFQIYCKPIAFEKIYPQ